MSDRKDALKDYVEVNVRVERFYEKYPNGRIVTEILSWENGVVVMKASVYRDMADPVPSATGHAYEKEGSTFINKTSALENCETSAVGRALAMLGFEIKKSIASKEEVENAKLNQNDSKPSKKEKNSDNNGNMTPVLKAKYQAVFGNLDGIEEYVSQHGKDAEKLLTQVLQNRNRKGGKTC